LNALAFLQASIESPAHIEKSEIIIDALIANIFSKEKSSSIRFNSMTSLASVFQSISGTKTCLDDVKKVFYHKSFSKLNKYLEEHESACVRLLSTLYAVTDDNFTERVESYLTKSLFKGLTSSKKSDIYLESILRLLRGAYNHNRINSVLIVKKVEELDQPENLMMNIVPDTNGDSPYSYVPAWSNFETDPIFTNNFSPEDKSKTAEILLLIINFLFGPKGKAYKLNISNLDEICVEIILQIASHRFISLISPLSLQRLVGLSL